MPFYWRLSDVDHGHDEIANRMPFRVIKDEQFDYLKYDFKADEWDNLTKAYKRNETIGFINETSGQLETYGSSVNNFFLNVANKLKPEVICEIGCGAGYTIKFLEANGFNVVGIDPSEYSLRWSQKLDFKLINNFFDDTEIGETPELIICNDVFEHVPDVEIFASKVFNCLPDGGVFCFATTDSTNSIGIGDVSMFEHQHVNMFTTKSIYQILNIAGFSKIEVTNGSYGNTFHVTAMKSYHKKPQSNEIAHSLSENFFEKASKKLERFEQLYSSVEALHFYVPLRCMSYLSSVGDFGNSEIYDSNTAWRNKYIDGYSKAIRCGEDVIEDDDISFFIGSLTFQLEIKKMLIDKGVDGRNIFSPLDLV